MAPTSPLANLHVAERHWTMVALEHEWSAGPFLLVPVVSGGREQFLVFVDQLAVERGVDNLGVRDLFPVAVEARRPEDGLQRLPLARRLAGIEAGSNAIIDVVITGFLLCAGRCRRMSRR